jgi:Phage tail assembly chaperone
VGSYLTRDAILAASALRTEDVPVPEWGGSVLVRELRGRERDEFEASLAVQRGNRMVPDVANMRAKLVARVVVGEDGEPVFSQQDVNALGELSAAALDRVFEVASRLSALNPDSLEEKAKNSATAQNGGSTST